jgi:hypothetical protein
VLDISGKVIEVEQVCVLFSQHSSSSSICIVSVFLDILTIIKKTTTNVSQVVEDKESLCTVCGNAN